MSRQQRVDATYVDQNGAPAEGYEVATVFKKPTIVTQIVSTGPYYAGDDIVVKVTGTTDPDAGPGLPAVEGGVVDPADPTLFHVTAVADGP